MTKAKHGEAGRKLTASAKKQAGSCVSESTHARNFIKWCRLHQFAYRGLERIYHVPNGGGRSSKAQAAILKAEGTRAAIPDYQLDIPLKGYHGLRIELKRLDGRASDDQIDEIKWLRNNDYAACFAFGWDAATVAVKTYYGWHADFPAVITPIQSVKFENLAQAVGGKCLVI